MTRRMYSPRTRNLLGALLVLAVLAAACGGSDEKGEQLADGESASCYEGETVTFVVPFSPGGGYDVIARGLAPYLEKELDATVVVENQEGAGGLTAANRLYSSKGEAKTFGLFTGQGLVGSVLGGSEGAGFDLSTFTYIGRLAKEARVLVTSGKGSMTTVADLQAADEVRYATSGVGANDYIDAIIVSPILDIKAQIITGYKGSSETVLAVASGDVDAGSGTVPTRMSAIRNGDERPVLILGGERAEELPDTPTMLELDLDDDQRALAEAHAALQAVGRAVLGPPGMPESCVGELVSAFDVALSDEKFLAEMESTGTPFDFLPGDELAQVVQAVLDAPAEYKELLQQAYKAK